LRKFARAITSVALMLSVAFAVGSIGAKAQEKQPTNLSSDRTIAYIPPVARAVLTGDPDQVVMALEKQPEQINAKVEAVKGKLAGYTPLILAAAISNVKIADILISRGANVAILDDYHRSALWYAAFGENAAVTEALLQDPNGAAKIVNEADNSFRRTPLHLAVRGDNPAVAQLLMQHGAEKSLDLKDVLGYTPSDYCKVDPSGACKYLR
jgi:hypothetical protein